MVETQNNEQFKNHLGVIDSPLACDVAGAAVKLVWTTVTGGYLHDDVLKWEYVIWHWKRWRRTLIWTTG